MNEFELIQNYFNWPLSDSTIELGIGDDAAIFDLASGYQLVTTTDTLSEGVHFSKDTSPEDIAHKSLAVNLSDIAAMGATAKYFTLAITLPKLDEIWLEHFSKSLKELSKKYRMLLFEEVASYDDTLLEKYLDLQQLILQLLLLLLILILLDIQFINLIINMQIVLLQLEHLLLQDLLQLQQVLILLLLPGQD